MSARRSFRVSVVTLAVMAVAAPFIARSATAILGVDSTTPMEWVPPTFPPRLAYEAFARQFQSGDVVVISWPGCEVGSAALEQFARAAADADAAREPPGRRWFDAVTTGSQVVGRLTAAPLSLDRDTAVERLRGVLVGPDGRTTCAVVGFTPAGLADRHRAVAWLRDLALRTAAIDADRLHMVGPVVDNVLVDEASADSLNAFAAPAAILILLLSWWSLGSLFHAALVFLVSLWCVGLCFLTLHACGDRMNPVLIVMPLLVLVLGVSGGIHLVNYLRESLAAGADGVAARAVRLGWLPCSLSAGTTAIGLGSLVVSELEPIRVFGFHAAIGVLAALACLLLVVPGLFERWPIAAAAGSRPSARGAAAAGGFAAAVVRRATLIVLGFFVAMAGAGAGIPGIRTSVRIDTLFRPQSRVIRDYAWIEAAIGPLVPIEVVLRFGGDHGVRAAERLELVQAVGKRLAACDEIGGVLSAAMFLPDIPDTWGARGAARRAVTARRLESGMIAMDDMRYVRDDGAEQLWRVTARVSALADIDYGDFLGLVRAEVEPLVAAAGGAARGISADFTGVTPLINEIQKTLLRDLFSSFLSACGLIMVVMMVVEGGVGAGLVAMVSNVFPMVLLFGLLGWTRTPLDIGSVMTASIALGMAIDGTLHFLTFYRRSRAAGSPPSGAVQAAFGHCAAAMTQSTVVCGLGILVFAASSFAPTSRFAWMLALLMAAALAGDLILLPAMLVGPLGRVYHDLRRPAGGGGQKIV